MMHIDTVNIKAHTIKRSLRIFLVAIFSLFISITGALAQIPKSDADELVAKLELLQSFSGDFQQTLIDDKGQLLQESSGGFLLQRPGYFLWETKEPFPQRLISNLQTIWLYDPDLEQVTIREYNEDIAQTPALLLSGDLQQINQQYSIKKISDSQFVLTPLKQQALFQDLNVQFVNNQLSNMSLKDALGQTTVFSFSNAQYGNTVSTDRFNFIPPEGTDVIVGN